MYTSAESIRSFARDESVRRVFASLGIPPEELAYTMASYSRSRRSFLETFSYINSQKAANFLETFYFAYGHRSIADMAHVPFAIENVSILAAIEIVSESLWDGQERSTRYQDFSVTGYVVPAEVKGTPLEPVYTSAADGLFHAYEEASRKALEYYRTQLPRPDGMDEKEYERTLRARAFDVARAALPLATHTSVGQITSARTLEGQISRLLSSPFGEVRRVGESIREAGKAPARNPVHEELSETIGSALALVEKFPQCDARDELQSLLEGALAQTSARPAAPTLVKYTAPNAYHQELVKRFSDVYQGLLGRIPVEEAPAVTLVEVDDPAVETIAKLLYSVGAHPFSQIVRHVQSLSAAERRELLGMAFEARGPHDPWPFEARSGYLNFDILMDIGSYRDLHRHRRCHQIRQPYTAALGFDRSSPLEACGAAGIVADAVEKAFAAAAEINRVTPPHGAYLFPLGARCRALFSMDLAELAYIAELRTRPTGHFSYRRMAYEMFQAAARRYPDFAPYVRAVDPAYEDLMER